MDYSDRTGSTRTTSEGVAETWENTRQKTGEMIGSGEDCVRNHPGTAILVALVGGTLLGALIGMSIAEARFEQRRHSVRKMMRDLQSRMGS